jgi:hypothetical protein
MAICVIEEVSCKPLVAFYYRSRMILDTRYLAQTVRKSH